MEVIKICALSKILLIDYYNKHFVHPNMHYTLLAAVKGITILTFVYFPIPYLQLLVMYGL